MKISATNFEAIYGIRTKREGDGDPQKEQYSQNQKKQEEEKKDDAPPSEEKVEAALEKFREDAKASGIDVSMSGKGPGLRVVLTDGSGAVIRQLSGEDFLKMRESGHDSRRGKILDQKL